MSNFIGDYEPTQLVEFNFNTRQADGTPTDQVQKIGGGTATWEALRTNDGFVLDATANVTLTSGGKPGFHKVSLDTDQAFFLAEQSYVFRANNVEVFDGVTFRNVSGTIVREFSLVNRTAGFVLTRSHKIFDGTITQVVDDRTFRITGTGINTTDKDFYLAEQLVFQEPSVNQSLSRVFVGYDNILQQVIVDEAFPQLPQVGEPFDLLHGQPLPLVTANIVLRAGSAVDGTTDAIAVEWHRNGEVIPKAEVLAEIPLMNLTVYSITYPLNIPTTTLVETILDFPIDQNTGTFQFALTNHLSAAGDGLRMECSATLVSTQRPISDSRTMFVSPV